MDKLNAMQIVLAAVEAGSLSGASRKLGTPLATVSRKVSQLEAHLGVRLLNRTSRKLMLTEAGRSYVSACKQILEHIGEAERAATGEYATPRGDLTISAPIVFGRVHVLPVVLEFLKVHSAINVRLLFSDQLINLQEEHIDVAVRISELSDSGLAATRIGAMRRVVCGSPAYFREREEPKTPRELGQHDCITSTFGGLAFPDIWVFSKDRTKHAVTVHSRLVVNAESAVAAAVAGLGITRVLSFHVVDHIRDGTLVLALQPYESPPLPVNLVYAAQRLVPLKLRAFLDFAAPRMKARLSSSLLGRR